MRALRNTKMVKKPTIFDLESAIGYKFKDTKNLTRSLTRLAFSKERGYSPEENLDALATLGDGVIDLCVLEKLVSDGYTEKGTISVMKTDLVNMTVLRKKAEDINLQSYVKWGLGEEKLHIWTSGRVLAESFEAIIGAVFIDGGYDSAKSVLIHLDMLP